MIPLMPSKHFTLNDDYIPIKVYVHMKVYMNITTHMTQEIPSKNLPLIMETLPTKF